MVGLSWVTWDVLFTDIDIDIDIDIVYSTIYIIKQQVQDNSTI